MFVIGENGFYKEFIDYDYDLVVIGVGSGGVWVVWFVV